MPQHLEPRVAEKQLLDVPLGLIEKLDYEGVTSEAEKMGSCSAPGKQIEKRFKNGEHIQNLCQL